MAMDQTNPCKPHEAQNSSETSVHPTKLMILYMLVLAHTLCRSRYSWECIMTLVYRKWEHMTWHGCPFWKYTLFHCFIFQYETLIVVMRFSCGGAVGSDIRPTGHQQFGVRAAAGRFSWKITWDILPAQGSTCFPNISSHDNMHNSYMYHVAIKCQNHNTMARVQLTNVVSQIYFW